MEQLLQERELSIYDRENLVLDALQFNWSSLPQVDTELYHVFTKGIYTRTIKMFAGSYIISKVHNTQHQFIVSQGAVEVINILDNTMVLMEAGYLGITEPGTRRLLYVHEDCQWTTIHPLPYITGEENSWSDEQIAELVARIESDIIDVRDVSYIGTQQKEIEK